VCGGAPPCRRDVVQIPEDRVRHPALPRSVWRGPRPAPRRCADYGRTVDGHSESHRQVVCWVTPLSLWNADSPPCCSQASQRLRARCREDRLFLRGERPVAWRPTGVRSGCVGREGGGLRGHRDLRVDEERKDRQDGPPLPAHPLQAAVEQGISAAAVLYELRDPRDEDPRPPRRTRAMAVPRSCDVLRGVVAMWPCQERGHGSGCLGDELGRCVTSRGLAPGKGGGDVGSADVRCGDLVERGVATGLAGHRRMIGT
jgi:hypothetical protein